MGELYKGRGFDESTVADAVYWNTLSHLDAFCLGGIIPVLKLDKKILKPLHFLLVFILIAIIAGAWSYFNSPSPFPYWNDLGYHHFLTGNFQHVWHYTIVNLIGAALVLFLISPYTKTTAVWIHRFFENKWMVKIGKVSYGMYVFHLFVLVYFYNRYLMPENVFLRILVFIPYAATVYGLAELSFRLYEKKFIDLKDRIFQK
jgi:peptidoglycan/LPS O-acetylase OafA/YrhL